LHSLDFTGRTVFVAGGSSGIGNGIARAFRAQNAQVHVCGTRPSAADYEGEDGSDLSGMTYHKLDLCNDEAITLFDPGLTRLDVLVCAQGITLYKRAEFEMAGFRQVMDVNLNSVMALSLRFQRMLTESKGSAVFVNSGAGFKAMIGNPGYGASKGGLRILTMSLAEAWAPDVRVNAIAPGYVDTRITKVTRDHPQRYEATLGNIPLKRWGTTDEMGGIALFLASDLASYITGQTIFADGGKILS
jgi:3-oxoacyl-[acyl-carrier protein] reductase